jgi:hypothetical protein
VKESGQGSTKFLSKLRRPVENYFDQQKVTADTRTDDEVTPKVDLFLTQVTSSLLEEVNSIGAEALSLVEVGTMGADNLVPAKDFDLRPAQHRLSWPQIVYNNHSIHRHLSSRQEKELGKIYQISNIVSFMFKMLVMNMTFHIEEGFFINMIIVIPFSTVVAHRI